MDLVSRIEAAHLARQTWLDSRTTNAYRLLNGAGDGCPGLVLDRYGSAYLLQGEGKAPDLPLAALPEGESLYWKPLGAPDRDAPQHLQGRKLHEPFFIRESGLQFQIDFQAGYSTGLFLDQRENRERIGHSGARRLLNCFAYTCSFSVIAAAEGMKTVSVDLSRHYLDWGRRNFAVNGLDTAQHEFFAGDVFYWLPRMAKWGRQFDAIVLDPPTFARNRKGQVFQVEKDLGQLIAQAAPLLAPEGLLLVSSNCRRLAPQRMRRMIEENLPGRATFESLQAGADFPGPTLLRGFWVGR